MLNKERYIQEREGQELKDFLRDYKHASLEDLAGFVSRFYLQSKEGKNYGKPLGDSGFLRRQFSDYVLEHMASGLVKEMKRLQAEEAKKATQKNQDALLLEDNEIKEHEKNDGLVVSSKHPGKSNCEDCRFWKDSESKFALRFGPCSKLGMNVAAKWTCDQWKPKVVQANLVGSIFPVKRLSLFVDFDGTLAQGDNYPEMGLPDPLTVSKILQAKEMGWSVVIYTLRMSPDALCDPVTGEEVVAARSPEELAKVRAELVAWLEEYGIPYDAIYAKHKPPYTKLLDDNVINVGNYEDWRSFMGDPPRLGKLEQGPPDLYLKLTSSNTVWNAKLLKWGLEFIDLDGPLGSAAQVDPHVTLLYGATALRRFELESWMRQRFTAPIPVTLRNLDVYTNEGKDYLVCRVDSPQLHALHNDLVATFGEKTEHSFNPHITLAVFEEGKAPDPSALEFPRGAEIALDLCTAMDMSASQIRFHIVTQPVTEEIKASLVDYPHEGLPTDLWVGSPNEAGYTLIPSIEEKLKEVGQQLVDQAFGSHVPVQALLLQGSCTSQFYDFDTDLDLLALIDPEVARGLDATNEELEKLDKEHSLKTDAGDRPVELRVHTPDEIKDTKFLEETDGLYDITHRTWIKKPVMIDASKFNRKPIIAQASKAATKKALEWDKAFGQINRDLHELELVKKYMVTEPQEKKKDLTKYTGVLLGKIHSICLRLWNERKSLREARRKAPHEGKEGKLGYSNALPAVVEYKLLTVWGYLPKIYAIGKFAKESPEFSLLELDRLLEISQGCGLRASLEGAKKKEVLGPHDAPAGDYSPKKATPISKLMDSDSSRKFFKDWAYENTDAINNAFEYEEHDHPDMTKKQRSDLWKETARREFDQRFDDVIYKIDELYKESTLTLYRMITVEDEEDFLIKLSNEQTLPEYAGIGPFWAFEKGKAEAHWGMGGEHVLLIGEVNHDDVDWDLTLFLQLDISLGDQEAEVRLHEGVPVKIVGVEVGHKEVPMDHPVVLQASLEGALKNTKNFKTEEGDFSVYDTEAGVFGVPSVRAALLENIVKKAKEIVEGSDQFKGYQTDSAKASALGEIQKKLADARNEAAVQVAWGSGFSGVGWDSLKDLAKAAD